MLEVFCDDFIHMAQTSDPAQFLHLSRSLLHGIHSVFPPSKVSGHNGQDPISKKKLDSGKGNWAVRKEVLGWMVDGATRCIELAPDQIWNPQRFSNTKGVRAQRAGSDI